MSSDIVTIDQAGAVVDVQSDRGAWVSLIVGISGREELRARIRKSIERNTKPDTGTRAKYLRAVDRAIEAGVDLMDRESLADYGDTLPSSSYQFLRSATRHFYQEERDHVEARPARTPAEVMAKGEALNQLSALMKALKGRQSRKEKAGIKSHTWLTPEEVQRLAQLPNRATVKGRRDFILLGLLVSAGIRREEWVNLKWSAINETPVKTSGGYMTRTEIQVKGKGAKDRVVPINPDLAEALRAWRKETGAADDDFIICGIGRLNSFTDGLTAAQVYNVVRWYGQQLAREAATKERARQLRKLAPHDLRRTYAQIGYDSGYPIPQISILLGHKSVETTRRYLSINLDRKNTISDVIPFGRSV